jgi:hypothetical protein
MTIVYVTTGAWGAGTGTPNSAAQVDGNFYDLDQRVVGLVGDLAEGKMIDSVTYTSNSFTLHFTDGTTQLIPLPVATLTFVGEWLPSTTYLRGQLISAQGGLYQVLQDHTSAATFDPGATQGGNPLYALLMPTRDVNYDAAIFVPGSIQRDADELVVQFIANRTMRLPSGNAGAYAYLEVGDDSTGATDIILSIEKNRVEIGTITFTAGDLDTGGGHEGNIAVPATVDFAAGDRYALRVTQSDNAGASGLSVTLPFLRTDI